MRDSTPGPPPEEEGKEWIVEERTGEIYRMAWDDFRNSFVGVVCTTFHLFSKDILRHAPYEPVPAPLKPWRRFRCVEISSGQSGTGAMSPYGGSHHPYRISWDTGYHRSYSQDDIDECIRIDWIDYE